MTYFRTFAFVAIASLGLFLWVQHGSLERAHRDLQAAEKRLAAGRGARIARQPPRHAEADPPPTSDPELARRAREVAGWMSAFLLMQRAVSDHPEWTIPETKMLSETDWLSAAHTYEPIDSAEKLDRALAAVRTAAKIRFATQVSRALKEYSDANGGALPTDLALLGGNLGPDADAAWLARYESVRKGLMKDVPPGTPVVLEKTPVDPEYDQRIGVPARGGSPSFNSWNRGARGAGGEATADYLASTGALSPADAQALSPPLIAAIVEYRRAHAGADPSRPADLLPYTSDPQARNDIEQAQRRKEPDRH